MSITAYERDVTLDALALMASAFRGESENVSLMHMAYSDPTERAHLYGAVLGCSTALLRVLEELGYSHEKALGACRAHAMDDGRGA